MKLVRVLDPGFSKSWMTLCREVAFVPPFSTEWDSRYQREYLADTVADAQDVSLVVETDSGQPVCGFRGFLLRSKLGEVFLNCMGRGLSYLEASPDRPEIEAGFSRVKEELIALFQEKRPAVHVRDPAWAAGRVSRLSLFLLESGAAASPMVSQIIDLTRTVEELRKGIRHSYRSLINWGLRELRIEIMDGVSVSRDRFDAFQNLHREVAGRVTRSQASWNMQYEGIRSGDVFLVTGSLGEKLVTGALYQLSANCCYYSVGASDRSLFEKPISHAPMWSAILHARKLGTRFFDFGDQIFPEFPNSVMSAKEVSISTFKRGFGGVSRVSLDLSLNPSENRILK